MVKSSYIVKIKSWQAKNKDKVRRYKRKSKTNKKKELRQIVFNSKTKCFICGELYKHCLDFHHRNPKDKQYNISRLVHEGYSEKLLLSEIAKCDVICSNCHRKHHWPKLPKHRHKKQNYVNQLKLSAKCSRCFESYWACLDYHHKTNENKILNIGAMIRDKRFTIDDLKKEIDKCELICSNCHRKEHLN